MQSRRSFLALAVFTVAASIGIGGCSDKPTGHILPAGSTVVALGDSLTYGHGASPNSTYPATLAELTQWKVINAGVNGNTSADVLARVDDVISGKAIKEGNTQPPDLVLLGIGGNDVLRRVAPEMTKANITATVMKLKTADVPVVLIAQPYFSTSALFGKASDNPIYKEISEELDVPLYSDGWSKILSDESLKSDQIHANDAGYRQFAIELYDYLKEESWLRR